MSYTDVGAAFTSDDILGLRALCSIQPVGLPIGSFPIEQPFSGVWPEEVASS